MFNLKQTTTKLFAASVITLSLFSSLSGVVPANAQGVPGNPNPIPGQNTPKINLITITCDQTSCNTNGILDWSKGQSSGNFTKWSCNPSNPFNGQKVLGIADYEDGISKSVKKKIVSQNLDGKNDARNSYRYNANPTHLADCLNMNEQAYYQNVSCAPFTNKGIRAKNNNDLTGFADYIGPVPACVASCGDYFLADGSQFKTKSPYCDSSLSSPVFAYQFRYNINFTDKVAQSEQYRSMTGIDGTYDGVAMTYTYYTYKDTTTNTWKQWKNPNADNIYRGWLVYGVGGEQRCPANGCEPWHEDPIPVDGVVTTTIKGGMQQNLTLTYNTKTKKLRFQGSVQVGTSGCSEFGDGKSFIVKPYSNGVYDSFKFFYETKVTGPGPCTANIPMGELDYTQDMSSLAPAGQQFLINYISQNRFKASDVEGYIGFMPVG